MALAVIARERWGRRVSHSTSPRPVRAGCGATPNPWAPREHPVMHGPYTQIVAIDLGKFNSVVCLFDPANGTHRFQSLATTPTSIHDLLASLIRTPADAASILVVFETCEVCGWVHDVATALGFPVAVANPCHEAWRWTKVKRKTDRDDALKLARMAHLGELPTVYMPPPALPHRRRRPTCTWRC